MIRNFLFAFLAVLFLAQPISATHIVGGELRYESLGNDQYRVSLTVYRDCYFGDPNAYFDDPASIGIFDPNTNELVTSVGQDGQLLIPLMGDDTLDESLNDPCLVVPPEVCVHTTTYSETVTLPFREGGYILAYQRCCRNQTLQNIVDPLATGATYLVRLSERAMRLGNNSPDFRDWPPIYICTDRPIDFDHSATDSDGDSLVYKLCTPLEGATQFNPRPQPPFNPPYDEVVWVDPPYNLDNLLGGDPLTINPSTGFMTGIPNTPGQFVVGVCVEEYRNDTLIGVLRRDFQYNVGECGITVSAFTSPDTTCVDNPIQLKNDSEFATDYTWIFGDMDQPDSISNEAEPIVQFAEPGTYTVHLIAMNETDCRDTTTETMTIQPFLTEGNIEVNSMSCTDSFRFELSFPYSDTISGDPVKQFDWTISYGMTEEIYFDSVPVITVGGVDSVFIDLTVCSQGGCIATFSDTLIVDFIPDMGLSDTLVICPGDSVRLNPMGTHEELIFDWKPDDGTLSDPESENPLAFPGSSTLYSVEIENDFGCMIEDSVFVEVLPPVAPFSIDASSLEVFAGETVELSIPFDPSYDDIQWEPATLVDPDTGYIVSGIPEETTTFTVTVTDAMGCMRTESITVEVIQCPPVAPISGEFTSNRFLVGDGFDEQVVRISGYLPVPESFEPCGLTFDSVQGGYFVVSDHSYNAASEQLEFNGWFHLTDLELLQANSSVISGKVNLCTEEGFECPVDFSIPTRLVKKFMCVANGLICQNMLREWHSSIPQSEGSTVGNTIQVYLPFLTSVLPDTCHINRYEAEIKLLYEGVQEPVLYDTYTFQKPQDSSSYIWNQEITLSVPNYEQVEKMYLIVSNNCGTTCTNSLEFEPFLGHRSSGTSSGDLKLMPNPARSEISFTYTTSNENIKVDLLNVEGRTLLSTQRNGDQSRHTLQLDDIPPGLYIMRIRDRGEFHLRKFIKQ